MRRHAESSLGISHVHRMGPPLASGHCAMRLHCRIHDLRRGTLPPMPSRPKLAVEGSADTSPNEHPAQPISERPLASPRSTARGEDAQTQGDHCLFTRSRCKLLVHGLVQPLVTRALKLMPSSSDDHCQNSVQRPHDAESWSSRPPPPRERGSLLRVLSHHGRDFPAEQQWDILRH
jgi:hypothetical protein